MVLSKKRKKGILLIFSIILVFSLTACSELESVEKTAQESAQQAFDTYCDELLLEFVGNDPIGIHFLFEQPENYGITEISHVFPDYTAEVIKEAEENSAEILQKLKTFDETLLTERQQLSLKTLISYMEKQCAYSGYSMMNNLFSTNTGLVANMSTNFIEFTFDNEEDVKLYLDLIKDTRRYVNQLLDFVRLQSEAGYFMSDYCVDSNIESCNDYLSQEINPMLLSFEEKIEAMDLSEELKTQYIAQNEEYIGEYYDGAYQDIIDTLTELKGTAVNQLGLVNFENGKEYYTAILKDKTSTDMEAEEIIELLDDELNDILTEISALYTADPTLLEQYSNVDFGMSDPEEILDFLAEALLEEFPAPYTTEFVVNYQSKGVEVEGTVAYYLLARLDNIDYNSIKINGSAIEGDDAYLYNTLAHEGFPGHLYQFTSVYANEDISNVCKLVNFIGFTEGYAEYVSDRAYVLGGCSEELTEFLVLDSLFGYVFQSRVDLGVNYEGWTYEDVVDFCSQYGVSTAAAQTFLDIVVADPGLVLPYTVGHILMRDLREKAETELGDAFDPVEYHQLILDTGIVDFEIMEEELDKFIEMKKGTEVE